MTNLYAALNVASGQVIGSCADRHRAQDHIKFLKLGDQNAPRGKVPHLIVDSASRRSFASVKELERVIMDCIHHWNESGRCFVWTETSKQILRSVRHAAQD